MPPNDIDPALVGSVINALPIDRMISAPLQAMVSAQVQAARSYADFILAIGVDGDGRARVIAFDYDEPILNQEGVLVGTVTRTLRIPLLAAVAHPNICVEEGTVDFELEVTQSAEFHSSTEGEASFEAKFGWGPFSVSMQGRASHKEEQTRKSDTRAKYSIHTVVKRQPPPESLARVIDYLTDSATRPITRGDANGRPTKNEAASLKPSIRASNAPVAPAPVNGGGSTS